MKSDPGLLLLASLGAALLTAGGAFLRAAFAGGERTSRPGGLMDPDEDTTMRSPPVSEVELAALREELAQSNATKEAQRIEMVEQRQRSERQVQGAQAEIQRLAAEVDSEKTRTKASEDEVRDLKVKVRTAEAELKRLRASGNSGETPAASTAELAELQQKLKAVTEEKDTARAKVEALERLVEGVRARSRDLAEQLKALKPES